MIEQKMSESELTAAEHEHEQAHQSLRNDFETLLRQTIEKAQQGEDVEESMKGLLEAYNSSSKSTVRVMSALRRLQNSQPKDRT